MKANKLALSVFAGTLACSVALGVAPAYADPAGGEYRTLTGVGSDTTQSVMNGLAETVVDGSSHKILASYDAINPTTGEVGDKIQTRTDGLAFARPDGSGAGVKALTSSIKGLTYPAAGGVDVTGQVDFARSSSGPSAAGTDLTFIPFAKDAVSYAYSNTGTDAVPAGLTSDDLKKIFNGDVTTYVGADSATHTYHPMLPQSGSGSRKFFLSALKLTENDFTKALPTFQENKGDQIDVQGEIAPFSAAAYIAQQHAKIADTITANHVKLGSVDSIDPIKGDGTLNASFPLARNVYNVVSTARLSGTSDADKLLQSVFAGKNSKICTETTVITDYGFGLLGDTCGDTSQTAAFSVDGSTPMLTATAAPRISGSAKVGATLTALPGTWTGTVTKPTFSYTWMRNGAAIAGATASTYKLAVADAGTAITVKVNAQAGSVSASATTAKVAIAKISSAVKASFDKNAKKHTKKGKVTVTIKASGVVAPTGTVTVFDGKKKVGAATVTTSKKGVVTIKLTKKLSKGKHKIKITYSGSAAVFGSSATLTLKVK